MMSINAKVMVTQQKGVPERVCAGGVQRKAMAVRIARDRKTSIGTVIVQVST